LGNSHLPFAELRAVVKEGLKDIAAGRISPFSVEEIIKRGEKRLQGKESFDCIC